MSAFAREAEFKLGQPALQCPRRRRSRAYLDLGGSWFQLILVPLVAALFAAMGAFAIMERFQLPDHLMIPATFFVFVATAAAIYMFYFTAPDSINFSVHERGFRYKHQLIRFEELFRIRVGRERTDVDQMIDGVGKFLSKFDRSAGLARAMKEVSDAATITVIFKNGNKLLMKNALVEYELSDLDRFFKIILEEHAELFDAPSEEQPAAAAEGGVSQVANVGGGPRQLAAKTRDGLDPTLGNPTVAETRDELGGGNYRPANVLLQSTRDPALRQYYVEALRQWTGRPHVFDCWKREDPRNGDAWLMSGSHALDWAWQARGGGQADTVESAAWSTFYDRLRQAESELEKASDLMPEDPAPDAFRLWCCIGLNQPLQKAREAFAEAVRRCPDHYGAHSTMLHYLCEKWYGSHDEMFAFARAAGRQAADGSLLHALIAQAHTERWLYANSFDQDPDGDDYFLDQSVRDEVIAAYAKSLGSPNHRPGPLSPIVANHFAYTLGRCGAWDSARAECERIGDYPTLLPWGYQGDPTEVYQRIRAALVENDARVLV